MKKNKSIVKSIFTLLCIIVISLNQIIFAVDLNSINNINVEGNFGDYRVYSRIGNEKYIYYDGRIQTNFEYYYLDKNGIEKPAYCLELGVDGAETFEEYYVSVAEKVKDEKLSNIILNGYPYKSINELGVANVTEAKYSTQFAIWIYLSNLDISKIVATSPSYNRVVNAIKQIYDTGINSKYSENNLIKMNYSKVNVDNVDKNYFSTTVSLEYNENIKDLNINLSGVKKYLITDELNNEISDLYGIHKFKILFPRSSILENAKVDLTINYNTLQTAIMFGESKIPNMQSVALSLAPITLKNLYASFDVEHIPVNFKLIKRDKENSNITLANVKFKIYSFENEFLGEYVTDEKGEINIDILKEFNIKNGEKIKIEEIESLDNYYLENTEVNRIVEINYDKENIVIIENEKIKGRIKIVKTSSDYNDFNHYDLGSFLKDAVYEIYDENDKLIQEIVTNEYGEAVTNDLLKGKYYIKEKKAPKYYVLDKEVYEVGIKEHNEIVTLHLKDSSQKKIELPKTGY